MNKLSALFNTIAKPANFTLIALALSIVVAQVADDGSASLGVVVTKTMISALLVYALVISVSICLNVKRRKAREASEKDEVTTS